MVYTYLGPEIPLGISIVTLEEMNIEELSLIGEKGYQAKGDLSFYDYGEGVLGIVHWEATKSFSPAAKWSVKCSDEYCFKDESGEPLFTLINKTNEAIKEFVSKKLVYVREKQKQDGAVCNLIEDETLSVKSRNEHKGKCVCSELKKSSSSQPFDWNTLTDGGESPRHCFTCSCGKDWWEYNPGQHLWAPVPDEELYQHLLERDGVPVTPCTGMKDGFYSIKRMREMGFIPLG